MTTFKRWLLGVVAIGLLLTAHPIAQTRSQWNLAGVPAPGTWVVNADTTLPIAFGGAGTQASQTISRNTEWSGVFLVVTAGGISGTTPTLAVQVQWSSDEGVTFFDLGPASPTVNTSNATIGIAIFPTNLSQAAGATPANLALGTTVGLLINAPLPRTWRIKYITTGTGLSIVVNTAIGTYQR